MKKGLNLLVSSIIIIVVVFGLLLYTSRDFIQPIGFQRGVVAVGELTEAQEMCLEFCQDAQELTQAVQWSDSEYCRYTIDVDGDLVNCWEAPISVSCQANLLYGGYPIICDQTKCLRGCR